MLHWRRWMSGSSQRHRCAVGIPNRKCVWLDESSHGVHGCCESTVSLAPLCLEKKRTSSPPAALNKLHPEWSWIASLEGLLSLGVLPFANCASPPVISLHCVFESIKKKERKNACMHSSLTTADPLRGHVLLRKTMFFCSLLINACGGDKIGNTSSLK